MNLKKDKKLSVSAKEVSWQLENEIEPVKMMMSKVFFSHSFIYILRFP